MNIAILTILFRSSDKSFPNWQHDVLVLEGIQSKIFLKNTSNVNLILLIILITSNEYLVEAYLLIRSFHVSCLERQKIRKYMTIKTKYLYGSRNQYILMKGQIFKNLIIILSLTGITIMVLQLKNHRHTIILFIQVVV